MVSFDHVPNADRWRLDAIVTTPTVLVNFWVPQHPCTIITSTE